MPTPPPSNRNRMKRRHAPGMWEDHDGNLHISIPELLVFYRLPDTPPNRARMTKIAVQVQRHFNPGTKIIHRDQPDESQN